MLKQYKYAGISYLVPFVFLTLFILDQSTVEYTDFTFWALFLVLLLPFGLIGLILSFIGLKKSKQRHSKSWDIGYAAIILGLFICIGGLIGIALIYVVVGS